MKRLHLRGNDLISMILKSAEKIEFVEIYIIFLCSTQQRS